MNKIYHDFLLNHVGDNYHLTRLNDRSNRRSLDVHRKDVYLVEASGKPNFVLLHFSSKYKTIFQNFLDARNVLGNKVVGDQWVVAKENLLILLPHLGSVFESPDEKSLVLIIDFLKETNEPIRNEDFVTPRYISNLISINDNQFTHKNLSKLIKLIWDRKIKFGYGAGIEDPSFRNFTSILSQTYLVDLDNFTTKVNLDYELGFLAADVDLEYGDKIAMPSKSLFEFQIIADKEINKIQFYLGYVSRLGTILMDYLSGENLSEDYFNEVGKEIDGLSLELLSTLE